ncbi:hypothetical protein Cgig2_009632 [Carnegiea gigantea]|uniref:Uncharacterized protein n=1 Tax=Carnegiea gigantea TaxID=171969 RepID=A0A9Q1Q758_9CARY|nr:hypothetical protein Cgig2_009632 [Carnegiea gigantea]
MQLQNSTLNVKNISLTPRFSLLLLPDSSPWHSPDAPPTRLPPVSTFASAITSPHRPPVFALLFAPSPASTPVPDSTTHCPRARQKSQPPTLKFGPPPVATHRLCLPLSKSRPRCSRNVFCCENWKIALVLAIHQISMCTAEAWLLEDKRLETKVAMMSIHNSISCEYTPMVLLMSDTLKKEPDARPKKKKTSKKYAAVKEEPKPQKVKELRNLGIGFGDMNATAENIPPGPCGA